MRAEAGAAADAAAATAPVSGDAGAACARPGTPSTLASTPKPAALPVSPLGAKMAAADKELRTDRDAGAVAAGDSAEVASVRGSAEGRSAAAAMAAAPAGDGRLRANGRRGGSRSKATAAAAEK
eukprot:TRINITY_DN19463_c0_g1_i1.p2 TRINITY_DN19463_c0_g1~~TRINITY_DN19463_c0_g1_i1.p2  ORF type:complete len:124 (-),score=9.52 TRINITY_DN19463_c0_g1_i1:226-597(-)